MGTRTITFCDGCKQELKRVAEIYQIVNLKTDNFCDAAGSRDHNRINLIFCKDCGTELFQTLDKILKELEKNNG